MKYMLLIYGNEGQLDASDTDIKPWIEYTEALQESGCYITGAGLLPTETATTVRVRDGETVTLDGPFAETKEQLGGYYLVDCKDLDEALGWAAKIPTVHKGSVEVRPLLPVPES